MKVGIVARFSDQWSAGQYYIENILCALDRVESTRPEITILSDAETISWSDKIQQPDRFKTRLIEPKYSIRERVANRIVRLFSGKNSIERRVQDKDLDLVFPLGRMGEYPFALFNKAIYWIPDFQEKHFPAYFTEEELLRRNIERGKIADEARHLVLSSQSAKQDFEAHYPHHNVKVHVLPFAVYNLLPPEADHARILDKYAVQAGQYFVSPNQFWPHKNQEVLVDAWKGIKDRTGDACPKLIFSGKEKGFPGEGSADRCKQKTSSAGLNDAIYFAGFMDRNELLVLIHYAKALLQPSMFEGWNTSVEDAKSLGCFVLASDISVHREQLKPEQLVEAQAPEAWMNAILSLPPTHINSADYIAEQVAFEERLLALFQHCASE